MKKNVAASFQTGVLALCLTSIGSTAYAGDTSVLRWHEVRGSVETGNLVGVGSGEISGAGQPFLTSGGFASLRLDSGRLTFSVTGLMFAGGGPIGTTGSFTDVVGTLVCDTDGSAGGGNSVIVETPLVPLSSSGAAFFTGIVALDPVCSSEPDIAFLIQNTNGMWVAHGAIRRTLLAE